MAEGGRLRRARWACVSCRELVGAVGAGLFSSRAGSYGDVPGAEVDVYVRQIGGGACCAWQTGDGAAR